MSRKIPRLLLMAIVLLGSAAAAAKPDPAPDKSDDPIPFERLSTEDVEKVRFVVKRRTLARKIRTPSVTSDLKTYSCLLDRLPLAAAAVRALGLQDYVLKRLDERSFEGSDGAGVEGTLTEVFRDEGRRVYYGVGRYKSRILGTYRGKVLLVLQYGPGAEGKIDNHIWLWVRVRSRIVGPIIRALSPIIGPIVDRKSQYLISAASTLAERASADPAAVYKDIQKSKKLTEEEIEEFRRLFGL